MTEQEKLWRDIESRKQDAYERGVPATARFVSTVMTEAGKLLVRFVHGCKITTNEDEYKMAPKWNTVRLAKAPEADGFWVYPHCSRCQVWVPREHVARHVTLWRLGGGRWENV